VRQTTKKDITMKTENMQKQNKTDSVVTKRNKQGKIVTIAIDGIDYDLFSDNEVSIPMTVMERVKPSEFPKNIVVMLEDENGDVYADTEGIHTTYIKVLKKNQTVVSCDVNLFREKWERVIGYSTYRETLCKLLELPELAGLSKRRYRIADDEVLNYSFDFTLAGETFGKIFLIALGRIEKTLKPLYAIEELVERELEKIWYPFS